MLVLYRRSVVASLCDFRPNVMTWHGRYLVSHGMITVTKDNECEKGDSYQFCYQVDQHLNNQKM